MMIKQLATLSTVSLLSLGLTVHAETLIENDKVSLSDEDVKAIYQSLSATEHDQAKMNPSLLIGKIETQINNEQLAQALAEEIKTVPYLEKMQQFNSDNFIVDTYLQYKIKEKLESIDLSKLAKQEYLASQEDYKQPNTIDLYHIFFLKDSNMSDASPEDKINEVYNAIKAGEITVQQAAKQYRIAVSQTNEDGLIKGVSFKQLPESFYAQIAKLDKGQMSEVFADEAGYHIIYIDNIHEGKVMPYNNQIQQELMTKLKQRYANELIESIKSQYLVDSTVKINETALDKVLNDLIR